MATEIIFKKVEELENLDPNAIQLKEILNTFLMAMLSNNYDSAKEFMTDEVEAVFSTVGNYKGKNQAAEGIRWKGVELDITKCQTSNYVAFYEGDKAQQSVYVHFLYAVKEEALYPFEFGGHMTNSYVKENGIWKLSVIRFDLDYEKGNTAFAKDWKLMDYKMYGGHVLAAVHEYESPYRAIANPENLRSEEERVAETMYRYAAGLDNFDFGLFRTSLTEDVVFYSGKAVLHNGLRNLVAGFMALRHKEAALQHSIKIFNVKVNGEEATFEAYRLEPHRLGSKTLSIDNYRDTFYSATYFNRLRKENGVWKMYEINYNGKVFMENEPGNISFID